MIDLHCHILPGLDDGSQSLEDSLDMARIAADSGVKVLVTTPHCRSGGAKQVREAFLELRNAIRENRIPLEIACGMEILGTWNTLELLKEGELLTLNGTRRPLVEFHFNGDGREETDILNNLCRAGYKPIVAHPERYHYTQRDPGLLNLWYKMGCRFQINKGSLLGRFGQTERELSLALVDRGFASCVASDAHSSRVRTPWMRDVYELLSREFSRNTARWLLNDGPLAILKNQTPHQAAPVWFE